MNDYQQVFLYDRKITNLSKTKFDVRILKVSRVNELDGVWGGSVLRKLLDQLEFPVDADVSDDDLRELCQMCLAEMEPRDAAEAVLKFRLGERLSRGQIENIGFEFGDEKLWEEYSDLTFHEELFNVGSLLFGALPDKFYEPDAVRLTVEIAALNPAATELLKIPTNESLLVRLLADGMSESSILLRLFDDQLAGDSFPESKSIIWLADVKESTGDKATIEVVSSCHWLDALANVDSYRSSAYADRAKVD